MPGLAGWINPIRDPQDRLYLYTFEISVSGGIPQPVEFNLGEDLRLADANGTERNGAYASPRSRAAPRWSSIKGDAGVSTLRERGVRTQQVAATSGRQRGNVWERAKPLRD